MNRLTTLLTIASLVLLISCKKEQENKETAQTPTRSVSSKPFGTMPDGKAVTLYTLRNTQGMEVGVINYGGIIVSMTAPDRNGKYEDVVLGFDSLSQYLKGNPAYFGALIGRFGNRIAKGKFSIDKVQYTLPVNNGENHLHGGKGFDKVFWDIEVQPDSSSLKLTYQSADGEQGYPGNLKVEVVYTLTDQNELKIDYKAATDKATVVNLTQHTYFNLSANMNQDILQHQLQINADEFLPVDKGLIPTGELRKVATTPFDFTTLTAVGSRINQDEDQLKKGVGYDHCWILRGYDGKTNRKIAELYDSTSGRLMEVSTTEPGVQFYSGNFLDGTLTGKGGVVYKHRTGLCLETQHYPDSPNQSAFPSVLLSPGQTYETSTTYKFATR